jgi:hypothetical protein
MILKIGGRQLYMQNAETPNPEQGFGDGEGITLCCGEADTLNMDPQVDVMKVIHDQFEWQGGDHGHRS